MGSDFGISGSDSGFSDESEGKISYGFSDSDICGESASSIVYRMRIDGLRVAVKRLRNEYCANPLYVAAYRKEYLIGRQLKHDSLPVYRAMHAALDEVHIVMDYVDGIRLDEFAATEEGRGYLSMPDNVRRFLDGLLNVTAYLHRSGVIHCDLKPANVMLRHSDRGVMLIDLDKSYTDILDLTHGGTKNISDPVTPGHKPTEQKDFAAIGSIVDYMTEAVPAFPRSSFRRFSKECVSGATNAYRLKRALDGRHRVRIGVIAAAVTVMVATLFIMWHFLSRTEDRRDVMPNPVDENFKDFPQDTVVPVIEEGGVPSSVGSDEDILPRRQGYNQPLVISSEEIDERFSGVIKKVEEGSRKIRGGNMTTSDMMEMVQKIGAEYQTIYNNLSKEYQSGYPELSDIDVADALIRGYEKSRISRIYMPFLEEYQDTMETRMNSGRF